MVKISLCMIVKDEQAVLARCLDSVRDIVDEVIVVDTGSTDDTPAIAARYGRVLSFAWCDDFAAARDFSFAQATMDYILWLDADDVIAPDDRARFQALKAALDGTTDVVMLPYHTAFDEQGRPTFTYYRERLLRRAAGFRWQGAVHECITPCGRVQYGDAAVEHRKQGEGDSERNLRIYQKLLAAHGRLDARGQFYYARELLTHGQHAAAVQAFTDFLDRPDGWVEDRIEACRGLSDGLLALGQREQARQALVRTFAMDSPRAETCCALAALELAEGRLRQAAFWYETALRIPQDARNGGFVQQACYGYTPCLGLCVCYDRMGRYREAALWNERAAVFRPSSPAVAYNRRYFARLEEQTGNNDCADA
ncbi:MAG: glycosyltransferase [Eubacteriales bacterium]|nr:glycosyltransferase [Eubacteriales bacterium]